MKTREQVSEEIIGGRYFGDAYRRCAVEDACYRAYLLGVNDADNRLPFDAAFDAAETGEGITS